MSYTVSTKHCWYNDERIIVKMYFLNDIPFTFDEMPDGHLYDKDLVEEARFQVMNRDRQTTGRRTPR